MRMLFAPSDAVSGKNYTVCQINQKHASTIVKRYHYSGKVVNNSKLHLGVFNKAKVLVGCLSYGPPMNSEKTASKISQEPVMYELNRMVMADDEPRNAESQAIGLCNKWLRKNTNVAYLLSFSDGKENNVGYIYQATNWKYLGYIISDSFYDLDGDIVHSVTVWNRYKEKHELRDTHTTHQILQKEFKNISIISSKQHVYVFPLRKKLKFYFDTKPYPKMDTEIAVLNRKWVQKNGVACNDVEMYTTETLTPIF